MPTINTILKEIKEVPVDRLEEVHEFLQSITPKSRQTERMRKKILSFGGAFSDMSRKDYAGFMRVTRKVRGRLFSRNVDV